MKHIFAVSDGSGATSRRVIEAALTQFSDAEISITRYGEVRTSDRIREIIAEVAQIGGFVVHTFVSEDSRRTILNEGRNRNVATIDLMGPLLIRLSDLLSASPRAEPGLFSSIAPSYMQRIEATNFAVRHDDGANIHELDTADIVLVGVSRTSKTPVSIYLAYQGWKVANVPFVLGIEPPKELFDLPRRKVVALSMRPERLVTLRGVRAERIGTMKKGYSNLDHVRQEIAYAYEILDRRRDWKIIDVTSKPIEEVAVEVLSLLRLSSRRLNE